MDELNLDTKIEYDNQGIFISISSNSENIDHCIIPYKDSWEFHSNKTFNPIYSGFLDESMIKIVYSYFVRLLKFNENQTINESIKNILKSKSDEEIERNIPGWKKLNIFGIELQKALDFLHFDVMIEYAGDTLYIRISHDSVGHEFDYIIDPGDEHGSLGNDWIFQRNVYKAPNLYIGKLNDDMIDFIVYYFKNYEF